VQGDDGGVARHQHREVVERVHCTIVGHCAADRPLRVRRIGEVDAVHQGVIIGKDADDTRGADGGRTGEGNRKLLIAQTLRAPAAGDRLAAAAEPVSHPRMPQATSSAPPRCDPVAARIGWRNIAPVSRCNVISVSPVLPQRSRVFANGRHGPCGYFFQTDVLMLPERFRSDGITAMSSPRKRATQ